MPFDPASLKFDAQGLIPCIAQDHLSGQVLMVAWMTEAAVAATLATGKVTYWSRSRQAFWIKGETSGHHQRLVELRVDCDRDCLLVLVEQDGPACHTNRRSCFYTAVRDGEEVVFLDVLDDHAGHQHAQAEGGRPSARGQSDHAADIGGGGALGPEP